eukprot:Skav226021  [mRNA]  locus=scaffold2502:26779:32301:+ [translate_table: standard]
MNGQLISHSRSGFASLRCCRCMLSQSERPSFMHSPSLSEYLRRMLHYAGDLEVLIFFLSVVAIAYGIAFEAGGPDYDEEARKLFSILNLSTSGAASDESSRLHSYRNLDAVWKHPTTGGQVFIGNATASGTRGILQRNNITHIVNCTSDLPNSFEGDAGAKESLPILSMLFFFSPGEDLYKFFSVLDLRTSRGVLEFFHPVFQWIDDAVNKGRWDDG